MKWDSKYFVTDLKLSEGDAPWTPQFEKNEAMRLITLDSSVREGAFIIETAWFLPGAWPATKGDVGTVKEHSHVTTKSLPTLEPTRLTHITLMAR